MSCLILFWSVDRLREMHGKWPVAVHLLFCTYSGCGYRRARWQLYCSSTSTYIRMCMYVYTHTYRNYWDRDGLVTGGQCGSNSGCQPYTLKKCAHHEPAPYQNCSDPEAKTPVCKDKCIEGYKNTYSQDKHYGTTSYSVRSEVKEIQTEIMSRGPVESSFEVYADFPTYRSGE